MSSDCVKNDGVKNPGRAVILRLVTLFATTAAKLKVNHVILQRIPYPLRTDSANRLIGVYCWSSARVFELSISLHRILQVPVVHRMTAMCIL